MEREYESKALISKQDFVQLLASLQLLETKQQVNTYVDTEDFFKSKSSALRLRLINNQYIFSLKQQDVEGMIEWNQIISVDDYNQIIESKTIDLSKYDCPYDQVLNNLEVVTIETTRHLCIFEDITIELDQTTFNQFIDYEIEIEAESIAISSMYLDRVIKKYGIDAKKSHPKIARYFMYN